MTLNLLQADFLAEAANFLQNTSFFGPCQNQNLILRKRYATFFISFSGKAQTAAVKRDAEIGVAQANRDAGIREAECEKAAMDVKYNTDTKIEDNSRAFKLQKANFDKEVNTAVSIDNYLDTFSAIKRIYVIHLFLSI